MQRSFWEYGGAIKFSGFTAAKMYDFFDMTGHYVGIIAFLITFGVIVIIIHFIGLLADKIADAASLGFVNRLLGIAFGIFKSVAAYERILCDP